MPADLDRRLALFLDEADSERALGVTPRAIKDTLERIASEQVRHEREDVTRHTEVTGAIKGLDFRVGTLERRQTAIVKGRGDPDASYHDYDAELAQARAILRSRVRDPADPLDERAARVIAAEAVASARNADKAAELDDSARRARKRRDGIFISVAAGILLLVAAAVTGNLLANRANASPSPPPTIGRP